MSNAVTCKQLFKRYEGGGKAVDAVNGLDLEVHRGECFGLLGPNGAGKTTTVEILEGLIPATSGEVEVLGMRWDTGHDYELRQKLGITLQETRLRDKLSVLETLQMFRSFYNDGIAAEEAMALVSLEEKSDAWISKLSGGQKQRVAVACALVGKPELVFLDEPTTGLDPQARRQLWDIVTDIKRAGNTVFLTTHYMDEAEKLCDRVAIVDHGKIIALGSPRDLITRWVANTSSSSASSPTAIAWLILRCFPESSASPSPSKRQAGIFSPWRNLISRFLGVSTCSPRRTCSSTASPHGTSISRTYSLA